MSFCTQCGKLLQESQSCDCTTVKAFCTQCGKPLVEGQSCGCTHVNVNHAPPEIPVQVPIAESIAESISKPIPESIPKPEITEIPKPRKQQHENIKKPIATKPEAKIENDAIIPEPEPKQTTTPDHETTAKQYHIVNLRNLLRINRAAGYLEVTDKKIAFRAENDFIGRKMIIKREYSIKGIAGIEAVSNHRLSFTRIVIGFLTTIIIAALVAVGTVTATHGLPWVESNAVNMANPPITAIFSYAYEGLIESWYPDINPVSLAIGLVIGFGGVALTLLLRGKLWFKLIFVGMTLGGFGASALTYNLFAFVLFVMSIVLAFISIIVFAWIPDLVISLVTNEGKTIRLVCARRFTDILHGTKGIDYAEAAPTDETIAAIQELEKILLS